MPPLDLPALDLRHLSPWAYAAAALVGLTAFALLPAPRRPGALVSPPAQRSRWSARWLRGRDDAVPLGRRALLGATLGCVVAVLVLQTPQALELMASCLAAGLPVRGACAVVVDAFDGPVAEDLGRVRALTELGVADADGWLQLAGHPQLGPAAADLARSVESGTLLVTTLRHHAVRARERRQAALQVVARSVGVRSVLPLMTCFIPAFLLLGVVPTVASALARALSL